MQFKRIFGVAIFLGVCHLARADAPAASPNVPLMEPAPAESAPSGQFGEILFTPKAESQPSESLPSEDRHTVNAGQTVQVCVRLSKEASPYLKTLSDKTMGLRLILEDSSEPPHQLVMVMGNRVKAMQPDLQGCYGGEWKIPDQ